MKHDYVSLLLFASMAAAGEVHYVSPSGTHLFPYTNWVTAATNIQPAVDASVNSGKVLVTNGTYVLDAEIVVDADIRLQSVNGWDVTIIDGNHDVRCLNLGSNACVVSGFTIRDGSMHGQSGGGVYCSGSGPVVTNCTLQGNDSSDGGGGMFGGTARDCRFIDNEGNAWGGGGMMGGAAIECLFSNNYGDACGGAIYEGTAIGCTFIDNEVEEEGGGLCDGWASNCVFEANRALNGGGLAYGSAVDCVFTNNRTFWDGMSGYTGGGGAYESALTNCLLRNNYAYWDGGGLLHGSAIGCVMEDNTAAQNGGGGYGITAINCLVINNVTDVHGGGAGLASSTAYNCTIAGNYADGWSPGGMYGTAYNCIIHDNENGWAIEHPNFSGTMYNSCCPDAEPGVQGNITNAPVLTAAYHLSANSPCINWGNNTYVSLSDDLEGNPRIVEGYVDMGCYEYQGILGLKDSDGDGLPDEWEHAYFGGNADPERDDDGDSCDNGEEQIADTVPTNPASVFMISHFEPFEIKWWPCSTGRYYSIWWSTTLLDGFEPLATDLHFPQNSYTDTIHHAFQHGFYRVGVEMQSE